MGEVLSSFCKNFSQKISRHPSTVALLVGGVGVGRDLGTCIRNSLDGGGGGGVSVGGGVGVGVVGIGCAGVDILLTGGCWWWG